MSDEITATAFNALLLLAIQEKIKTEMPEIKWCDQDLGQLEDYEQRPPVKFPCVLVDFPDTDFDQDGDQYQTAKQVIQFKLGYAAYSSAEMHTPVKQIQNALFFYELEKLLYQVFQQWDGNEMCQPMIRFKTFTGKGYEGGLMVRVIQFSTTYMDDTARDYHKEDRPALEIKYIDTNNEEI